jgi:hypothetical protein
LDWIGLLVQIRNDLSKEFATKVAAFFDLAQIKTAVQEFGIYVVFEVDVVQ